MKINGKTKEQIIAELSEPFPVEELSRSEYNFYYAPYHKYLERLDDVIGRLNYSIVIGDDTKYDEQCIYKCVEIIIFDDDGKEVCRKTGCGGYRYVYPEGKTLPKEPEDANDSAFSDAVKRACKLLGVGKNVYQLNQQEKRERNLNKVQDNPSYRECTNQVEEFYFTFNDCLVQDGSMKNSYHASVTTKEGLNATLIVWKEDANELKERGLFDMLMKMSKNHSKAKVKGVYQEFGRNKYPQIVFKGV